ncbi:MAG: LysM peptidoglycan-binding domain-containing protein [Flavobacteriales bacterium]|nr:LysM peptidoglycan-binding domain-containing protein [Flavobacteriales bacterium]
MRIVLVAILLVTSTSLLSQVKIIHEGEACYLHEVEKGNTLYGISKLYAISIDDVLSTNPEARMGLNIGQRIYIPISKVNRKEAKRSPDLDGNVLIHKVLKKETIYSLSKKYKVDINAILEANPDLDKKGLRKGGLVYIPTNAVKVSKSYITPAAIDSLIHHEVLLGETLYSLSRLYEVSIDSIKQVNAGLEEGLRAGMTLRIPKYVTGFLDIEEVDSISVGELIETPTSLLNIGLLLPFSLNASDSARTATRSPNDVLKMTDIAYEFYRGVQTGLEELSNEGLSANVVVMDVSGDRKGVEKCLNSPNIKDLDFIIGPLHKESFEMISNDGRIKEVFRTSPLSGSLDVTSIMDKNISKVKPSANVLINATVDAIKKEHEYDNLILISGKIRSLHNEFLSSWGLDTLGTDASRLKKLTWDKEAHAELLELIDPDCPNVLVYPVAHRPAITSLISSLATSDFRDVDITLYGVEEWMKYDNLDVDVLERVNLKLAASYFIDWENQEIKDFVKDFSEEYNTIPSSAGYGIIAYDITRYYLAGMMRYGPGFLQSQDQLEWQGLCIGFNMSRVTEGGWVNHHVYMLEYDDYQFKSMY